MALPVHEHETKRLTAPRGPGRPANAATPAARAGAARRAVLALALALVMVLAVSASACSAAGPPSAASLPESAATGGQLDAETAMELLAGALGDKVTEGTALVADGEDTVDGKHCWLFAFGASTAEKFTAEEHYAVADDGDIYVMDIVGGGEYRPYEAD